MKVEKKEKARKSLYQKSLSILHNPLTAWTILFISLGLTFIGWKISSDFSEQLAKDRFDFKVNEIMNGIEERMSVYEQALRGGVALFNTNKEVTREQWKQYVESIDINQHWPGIQGIGYSIPLEKNQLEDKVQAIREEGFPEFGINPSGERDEYSMIIYLEPFDWRNQRAFGYDMWSNEMRRQAMKRARDTGQPATSGIITLVQETGKNIQKGFLTYFPVYDISKPLGSVEERRDAFKGWVYSPFRTGDLMHGIIGSEDLMYEFEIFDGDLVDLSTLLYDSDNQPHLSIENHNPDFSVKKLINVQGRPWTIYLHTSDEVIFKEAQLPVFIAVAGVAVDILLFYVIFIISNLHKRASNLAIKMARDINTERQILRTVFDNVPIGIHVKDSNSEITLANNFHHNYWNTNTEEDLLNAMNKYLKEHSYLAEDKRVLSGETIKNIETKRLNKNNQSATLITSKYPLRNSQGEIDNILIITNDITEKKKAEEEIINMQSMLKQTGKVAKVGGWEYFTLKDELVISNISEEILNLPGGHKHTLNDFMYHIKDEKQKAELNEIIINPQNYRNEWSMEVELEDTEKNSKWIRMIGNSIKCSKSNSYKVYGTIQNIHIEKITQLELEQAKLRLELATRHAGIGIWEYILDTQELVWDDNMFSLYGVDKNTPILTYDVWKNAIHPDDEPKILELLDECLIGNADFNTEFRIIRPDKSIRYIRAHAVVKWNELGEPMYMLGTNWDITKEKNLEQSLMLSTKRAKSANKAKSEFLANMSHEIRTPLNSIIGFSELMIKTNLNNTQNKYMSSVHNSGKVLLSLLNDILDFSKIEAGKLKLNLEDVAIQDLVKDVLDIVSIHAYEKNVEVIANIDNNIPSTVRLDPVRVRQVMLNLVGNAIKFTEVGEVEIDISVKHHNEINKTCTLLIAVRDTGIGIPINKQELIMRAFSQADYSTTRQYGGTGLGLAITSNLLRLMDSELSISSEENKGSKFSFELDTQVIEEPNIERLMVNSEIKNSVILVNNMRMGAVISNHLALAGISSQIATSTPEAVGLIETHTPQLVICDYTLPYYNIVDFLSDIPDTYPCFVLAMVKNHSDLTKYEDEIYSLKHIHFNHIIKPFISKDLISKINEFYKVDVSKDLIIEDNRLPNQEPTYDLKANYKILIVDDNSINLILAESMVKSILPHVEIIKAYEGRAAVEAYKLNSPDLVLMDLQMPVMSGYEATKAIRKLPQGKATPIIALTAATVKNEIEKCFKSGMNDYLSKPISSDRLTELLMKYVNIPKSTAYNTDLAESNLLHFNQPLLYEELNHDTSIINELLNMVLDGELYKNYEDLDEAYQRKDITSFKNAAHKLKGTCMGLRFEILAEIASKLNKIEQFDENNISVWLEKTKNEVKVIENLIAKEKY